MTFRIIPFCAFIGCLFFMTPALSQNVGIGTNSPDASAQLHIESTSKGLLIPRMSDAQMRGITTPAKGLLVFNATDSSFYMRRDSGWVNLNSAIGIGGWSVTGNAGTDTSKNFIGTTDNKGILFKVNNKKAGFIEDTLLPSKGNTAIGLGTLASNTGTYNTAFGAAALNKNQSGQFNVAVGFWGLKNNQLGYQNTALGTYALADNNNGHDNTAAGNSAMTLNTDGAYNSSYGANTLVKNLTGNKNTAIGAFASNKNTTGSMNVALGYAALNKNTDRSNLVAIGDSALLNNGTGTAFAEDGTFNTAVGSKALLNNTTGAYNTAIGSNALDSTTSGYSNTAVGANALQRLPIGDFNTAIGSSSMDSATGGNQNTAVGYLSLYKNVSGDNNIAIGTAALNANTTGSSNMAIGYLSLASNQTGNSNIAVGERSLGKNISGEGNLAFGYGAGQNNISGNNNTFLGYNAGFFSTGSENIFLGDQAGRYSQSNYKLYINVGGDDSLHAFIYGDMLADSLRLNANTQVSGYTRLGERSEGAPAIKMKKFTITMPGTQGATIFVSHGLTQTKIISITAVATVGNFEIPAGFLQSGYQFTVNADNGRIAVNTIAGQSANILNTPVKVLVTYEE